MRSLGVDEPPHPSGYAIPLVPISLHRTKGRNVQSVNDRGVASIIDADAEFCQGYVFTAQPMHPEQTIVVQMLSTESASTGTLAIGLTSCDPASLRPCDLPAEVELLLDRPEYWVIRRVAVNGLGRVGDEFAVTLTMDGEVTFSKNGSTPVTVMHVDPTVKLWAFIDICRAAKKVRMLTSQAVSSSPPPPQQLKVLTGTATPVAGAGGTVSMNSLPPQNNAQNAANHEQGLTLTSAHSIEPIRASSQPCLAGQHPIPAPRAPQPQPAKRSSTSQISCNEQVEMPDEPRPERIPDGPSTSGHQPGYPDIDEGNLTETELSRTTGTGDTLNTLPPLTFHSVHGKNVRLSGDGSVVCRVQRYDHCMAFSARPVRINEKVCLRFVESCVSSILFGFTSHDPASLAQSLPKYAYPDLTNKPGYWLYCSKKFCKKGNIFHFFVNSAGEVHFGINGEDKKVLSFTGLGTSNPLWAFVDLYNILNSTAVQFVDPRAPNQELSTVDEDRLAGSMRALGVDEPSHPPRYPIPLVPLSFHRTKGSNVQFVDDRGVAARVDAEIGKGSVFTAWPMRPGQTIVVQILITESAYDGALSIGLTSCDPASFRPCDFPSDVELLLDLHSEYWVVRRDAANGLGRGDEFAFTLTMNGEVRGSRNRSTPVTLMHVDHTKKLWAFIDICGAAKKVRMLMSLAVSSPTPPPLQSRVIAGTAAPLAGAGGNVSVDSLPPQNRNNVQNAANHQQGLTLLSANPVEPMQASSQPCLASQQPAQCISTTQNNCNEQILKPNREPRLERIPDGPSTSRNQPGYSDIAEGTAPRDIGPGGTPSYLPPLTFHSVHGKNVRIFKNGSISCQKSEYGHGIAFSARPVRVNEKVCLRFVGRSTGFIHFGFTSHDPASLADSLPKFAWPDLTNKPGNWANVIGEKFCKKGNVLHFYVNPAGDVHFSINGEDKGLFFTGVETKEPLWALVDVYGKRIAVEFVKGHGSKGSVRAPNQVRRPNIRPVNEDRLAGSMRFLDVVEPSHPPRYANPLVPLSLHRTKGRNIQFVNDDDRGRGVAARVEAEIGQCYVFTAQPMRPGQTIVVEILSTESDYAGYLSFGLTSCDPASLQPCDLPTDAEILLDRPEYWVVQRDAANRLGRGDELAVMLTFDGEVTFSKNGSTPVTVMHVDHTVELWAFVDIDGAIQKVRMLTTPQAVTSPPEQLGILTSTEAPLAGARGTVLVDSSPPQNNAHNADHQRELTLASAHYIEPIQASSASQPCLAGQQPADRNSTETECTICFDNPIDSALCNCGHMCMCHSCAVQQWTGKGSGQCPICRAEIVNVLRIYKP